MCKHPEMQRVLGVDPAAWGFSFAVLEPNWGLVDWGGREAIGERKNAKTVAVVKELIQLYRPGVLALEDCRAPGSRRRSRVRGLVRSLERAAEEHGLRVTFVGLRALREACTGSPAATKHDVAVALAQRFLELARGLPPKRKLWMSEHYRMGVFNAVALAVTALEVKRRRGRRPPARGDP